MNVSEQNTIANVEEYYRKRGEGGVQCGINGGGNIPRVEITMEVTSSRTERLAKCLSRKRKHRMVWLLVIT